MTETHTVAGRYFPDGKAREYRFEPTEDGGRRDFERIVGEKDWRLRKVWDASGSGQAQPQEQA